MIACLREPVREVGRGSEPAPGESKSKVRSTVDGERLSCPEGSDTRAWVSRAVWGFIYFASRKSAPYLVKRSSTASRR